MRESREFEKTYGSHIFLDGGITNKKNGTGRFFVRRTGQGPLPHRGVSTAWGEFVHEPSR